MTSMTPIDVLDESGSNLVREYAKENEIAVIVRTKKDDVSVIAPDYNRPYLAKMLRIAASMLEQPKDKSLN